ncbi:MAG TPA: MraY family glycosyltransferase [Ilumatobacter sp.]|nr:MraY family glycosyltransferase [Ilumatobacter sp.]
MAPSFGDYLLIGGVAAVVTFAVTPLVGRLARARGWVYEPNERSVHTSPIPHVGGLAMLTGLLVALVVARSLDSFDALFADTSEPIGIVLAGIVVFITGLLDDIFDMAPPGKVTGVVLAGLVLSYFGATMLNFRVPFYDVVILSADWIPLATVLWLLGMTQAINLIDGLDGLAAGIVAIGSGAFFLYSNRLNELGLLSDRNVGPLVAIITAGMCIGFLPHNFNPARIFMGDSGAFLLGLLLAVSTSMVGGRADPNTQAFVGQTFFFFAPLAIPLLILGVPILDTLFAIVRRASKRQALDVADKGHLHHRLMNLGHGHRRSVLILWTWTALLSAFVLYPVLTDDNPRYLPFGIGALAIVLFTVLHPSVRRRRAEEVEAALQRPASEQIDPSRPERREQYAVAEHRPSPSRRRSGIGAGAKRERERAAELPPAETVE